MSAVSEKKMCSVLYLTRPPELLVLVTRWRFWNRIFTWVPCIWNSCIRGNFYTISSIPCWYKWLQHHVLFKALFVWAQAPAPKGKRRKKKNQQMKWWKWPFPHPSPCFFVVVVVVFFFFWLFRPVFCLFLHYGVWSQAKATRTCTTWWTKLFRWFHLFIFFELRATLPSPLNI